MSKTCKKLLASALAVTMLFSACVSALVVSAATIGTLEVGSDTIVQGDTEATIDITFTYAEADEITSPHKLIVLTSENENFTLDSVVVTEVNEKSDYEVPECDDDGIPLAPPTEDIEYWPAYISDVNSTTGQVILETYVDENYKQTFKNIVLTATYTIPAETVAGSYAVTVNASATDYAETDYEDLEATGNIVIEAKPVEPVEPERTHNFASGNSVQIRLIEPWGLKINTMVTENGKTIDYDTLTDYGIYFWQATTIEENGKGSGNFTDIDNEKEEFMKYVVENGKGYLHSQGKAEVANIDGNQMITAIYDEGLYTYQMDRSFYCVTVLVDENGAKYYSMRERNLLSLLQERKDDSAGFPHEDERAVYTHMYNLFNFVTAYREGKDTNPTDSSAPVTVAEYDFTNVSSTTFGNSVQVRVIEPWGLKVNAYHASYASNDYADCEDYGFLICYDLNGVYDATATAEDILADINTLVYSKSGNSATVATIDGNRMFTSIYEEGIYTYQLDTDAYVVPFIKINGVVQLGAVKIRNMYDLCKERSTTFADENECGVYESMYNLYDNVKIYRARFGV